MCLKKIFKSIAVLLLSCLLIMVSACHGEHIFEDETSSIKPNLFENNYSNDYQQTDYAALYEMLQPSIAKIKVNNSICTGYLINRDKRLLITSAAVFKNSNICEISFSDKQVMTGNLLLYSTDNSDLAIVQITDYPAEKLPNELCFRDSDGVNYGEDVFTIANEKCEEDAVLRNLFRRGIVSKPRNSHSTAFLFSNGSTLLNASFYYLQQLDLVSTTGFAGAPIFDSDGFVVGTVNLRAKETLPYANKSIQAYGLTFATPSQITFNALDEHLIQYNCVEFVDPTENNFIINAQKLIDATKSENPDSDAISLLQKSKCEDYFIADSHQNIITAANPFDDKPRTLSQDLTTKIFNSNVKIIADSANGLSEGSGFIVSKDGYVITNLHVINKYVSENINNGFDANHRVGVDGVNVYCLFEQGTRYENSISKFILFKMNVVAYDKKGDLALLKFKNNFYTQSAYGIEDGFTQTCILKTSKLPSYGDYVMAIGNALGYGVSVSTGIVSLPNSKLYRYKFGYDMIQTDCVINSGNSGGALFDRFGNVVGVNTLGIIVDSLENVSMAIPSSAVQIFLDKVNKGLNTTSVAILQKPNFINYSIV